MGGSKYGASHSAALMKQILSSIGANGRHPELVVGVEYGRRDRDQRDEEDIRRGDAQQLHGEVELRRILEEAGRADIHDDRRGDDADQRDHEQDDRQHRGDVVDQQLGLFMPAAVPVFAEDRHERLRERALGEQAAQQVGQPERDEERIGRHARAEHARDQHVAHEGEDARNQGQAADRGQRFKKIHRHQRAGFQTWRIISLPAANSGRTGRL